MAGTEHYPYGTRRFTDGEPDPHGFTGKETDEGTGLTYFGKRYLDPLIGRWTAPDPHFQVLEDLSVNRIAESTGAYSFNAGDPVNYRDETGTVRTTVRTGFWGKFKMARALKKGRIRPNMTWAITFGIKPHKRIGWKTAWRLAKTAQKTFGRHGGYKTDGGMVKVRTPFVSTELRGLQLNRQLTREIADATNNTNTRLRQSFSTLPAFGKEKSQNKLVKWATKLGMSRKEAVQTMFYGSTGMIQRAKQQGHSKRTLNLKQASKGIKAKGWSTKGRK